MATRRARRTRKDDVMDFIVRYADENNGITPSTREIAAALRLSQTRIHHLLTRLTADRMIAWVSGDRYKVVDSEWEFTLCSGERVQANT